VEARLSGGEITVLVRGGIEEAGRDVELEMREVGEVTELKNASNPLSSFPANVPPGVVVLLVPVESKEVGARA